ncbi:hypothetical protein EHE19_018495 [Ruminiclostridium herbifermentans]|uniref:Acetyltransferase n=1 Tax=Ruminiclostridium herbifermentans TaxID=2488810 RepID=A0A7H1VN35_9FIRM|nr:DapH/DapD/GlmU-related protein [Ruminiclostridium herbifermentans]QNU66797.1 hypothetical protein EHE19_018495 [Ruminiclostridium herbifermentans]
MFITSGDHEYTKVSQIVQNQGRIENEPVAIEDDVWIGANVSILRGVRIMEGAIVGTASVITKDVPPYCVCVGNPCKPIKLRYSDEQLLEHLTSIGKTEHEANKILQLRQEILTKYNLNLK